MKRIAVSASTRLEEAAFIEIAESSNAILKEMFYDFLRDKGHDVPPEHVTNLDPAFFDALIQGKKINTVINLMQRVHLSSDDLLAYIKENVEMLLHQYAYLGLSKTDQAQKGLSIILLFYKNKLGLTDRIRSIFLHYINNVLSDMEDNYGHPDITRLNALKKLKEWVGYK